MDIFVNGDKWSVAPGTTLAALARRLGPDPRGVAIERNLEIVPKSAHEDTVLQDGDRLEVVQFVGGG